MTFGIGEMVTERDNPGENQVFRTNGSGNVAPKGPPEQAERDRRFVLHIEGYVILSVLAPLGNGRRSTNLQDIAPLDRHTPRNG